MRQRDQFLPSLSLSPPVGAHPAAGTGDPTIPSLELDQNLPAGLVYAVLMFSVFGLGAENSVHSHRYLSASSTASLLVAFCFRLWYTVFMREVLYTPKPPTES